MYYKGANLLNTIRSIYNDDDLWWKTLKDYTETNRHKIITTQTTEDFFNDAITYDLQPVFDQYLRHAALPELQFKQKRNDILYRWKAEVKGFDMPIDIIIDGKELRLYPTEKWQKLEQQVNSPEAVQVQEDKFYIKRQNLKQA
jgi:aminopeptidase N